MSVYQSSPATRRAVLYLSCYSTARSGPPARRASHRHRLYPCLSVTPPPILALYSVSFCAPLLIVRAPTFASCEILRAARCTSMRASGQAWQRRHSSAGGGGAAAWAASTCHRCMQTHSKQPVERRHRVQANHLHLAGGQTRLRHRTARAAACRVVERRVGARGLHIAQARTAIDSLRSNRTFSRTPGEKGARRAPGAPEAEVAQGARQPSRSR